MLHDISLSDLAFAMEIDDEPSCEVYFKPYHPTALQGKPLNTLIEGSCPFVQDSTCRASAQLVLEGDGLVLDSDSRDTLYSCPFVKGSTHRILQKGEPYYGELRTEDAMPYLHRIATTMRSRSSGASNRASHALIASGEQGCLSSSDDDNCKCRFIELEAARMWPPAHAGCTRILMETEPGRLLEKGWNRQNRAPTVPAQVWHRQNRAPMVPEKGWNRQSRAPTIPAKVWCRS